MTLNENTRRWLYTVGIAAISLLTFYGIIDGNSSELWSNLIGATLGLVAVTHIGQNGVDEVEE